MYEASLQVNGRSPYYFYPEGLPRDAINYFFREKERMYRTLQKRNFQKTACEGYLDWLYTEREPIKTDAILGFEKKIGVTFSNNLRLTNADGTYSIPLAVDSRIDYKKFLSSYCRLEAFVVVDKKQRKCLLVTDISLSEPTYDFSVDPQFLNMKCQNLDDILALFPSQAITNREEKQKAILLALVGAQEKKLTKGGVGTSILLPSNPLYASKLNSRDLEKLLKSINSSWFPSVTRNAFSPNTPSFLSGTYQNALGSLSNDPHNFLSYKVNRELVQKIPNTKADPRVLEMLSYSHSSLYLDEKLVWLGNSNPVNMLLMRARISRVSSSQEIYDEATLKEKELKRRLYDEFRSDLKIPTAIIDLAEALAKINGKDEVSSGDVTHAAELAFELSKEAADEVGEQTAILRSSIVGMSGKVRLIFNLISDSAEGSSKDEIKRIAREKGVQEMEFDKAILELKLGGEIYETQKDGKTFMKKTG